MVEASLRFVPQVPIPPGEVLGELLEERGMTQTELARRTGLSKDHVSRIIRGVAPITCETALSLERVLRLTASFWLRLETTYRELLQRGEERKDLEEAADIVRAFPYAELMKLGRVARVTTMAQRADELLRFMGVGSFEALARQYAPAVNLRVAATRQPSPYALAAWLRIGEIEAESVETAPFDEQALRGLIGDLRALSRRTDATFQDDLRAALAGCGVALCLVPHLPKTYAHGATQWLRPDKAIIELSLRCAYVDIFWFTLFHEIGHLLLHHSKKQVFINFEHTALVPEEQQANRFAQDTLIPPSTLRDFIAHPQRFSRQRILHFAEEIGIAPAIVVGRLQHEGQLPQGCLSDLRPRLQWVGEEI